MDVKQIYDFTNYAVEQATGQTALLKEDLSNVVEIGDAVMNANALDKYVDALVNHIGKMIFVTRVYNGVFAKLQMDSWEFGSVLEKVTAEMPKAEENESWELTDGVVYEENQFYKPIVSAKFYNKMTTFEIPLSITEKQVKQSFSNSTQLNSFISMIFNSLENAMTLRIEELSRRAINNLIAETMFDAYGSGSQTASSGTRAVNLLYLYNQTITTPITASKALYDENFLKFASYTMSLYIDRLKSMSTLFNVGGKTRFTPKEDLHFVVLSNFAKASDMYLQSDTFHKELVALPQYESVPYFQGTGTTYDFADTSKIYVKTASGNDITINGVVGVMFDRDACAVNNFNRRTTSKWNAKAEFTNYWNKCDARYFNDLNENCVVFFIA
jgi:hypothetical protein